MPDPAPLEVHKALADDTRYRLYRYLGLSGRPGLGARAVHAPVPAPEHPAPAPAAAGGGRPGRERGPAGRERRAAADAVHGDRPRGARGPRLPAARRDPRRPPDRRRASASGPRSSRASGAPTSSGRSGPEPGAGGPAGPNLAVLQEALAEAGFDPRFRRRSAKTVEITLRDCPFRDLLDEHRELVCAVHRGLLEGMLGASRPPLAPDASSSRSPSADRLPPGGPRLLDARPSGVASVTALKSARRAR